MGNYRLRLLDFGSLSVVSRDFERFMPHWFRPTDGEYVADIGSNFGKYTLLAAEAVGETGRVLSVEPYPATFLMLRENLRLSGVKNVLAVNVAAWSRATDLTLFLGDYSDLHSAKMKSRKSITVKAKTVDGLIERFGRVDWLKIDVEGAEVEVLEGAERTIRNYRPRIIIEVFPYNRGRIKNLAKRHDYGIVEIGEDYWLMHSL
jgi:FkbM family methyltransferase